MFILYISLYSSPLKQEAYEVIDWPHVRQAGFQNPRNFCYRNLKSWVLESGIHSKESEIPLTFGIRIQVPLTRNPESILGVIETIMIGSLSFVSWCWHCSVSFQSSFGGCTCSQHQETELKPVLNYLTYGWMCFKNSILILNNEVHLLRPRPNVWLFMRRMHQP